MNLTPIVDSVAWHWLFWGALVVVGMLGLLALASPRAFAYVAASGKTWIDVDRFLRKLDHRVDIDSHVLRHSRAFGAIVVLAVLLVVQVFVL